MHTIRFQYVTYVETIESFTNTRMHVHVSASGRVCVCTDMNE